MTALLGIAFLSQIVATQMPDQAVSPRQGPSVELHECSSTDALVGQGLLAVEVPEASDGGRTTGFLYRGTGSLNMFDRSAEPNANECRALGTAVVVARQVTAILPRSCGDSEMVVVSDLLLLEGAGRLRQQGGVVVARQGNAELGRVVATAGRFILASGSGSVSDRIRRGDVPRDVREQLEEVGVSLVGAASPDGDYLVVDEGQETAEGVRELASGRATRRRSLPRFALVDATCSR